MTYVGESRCALESVTLYEDVEKTTLFNSPGLNVTHDDPPVGAWNGLILEQELGDLNYELNI